MLKDIDQLKMLEFGVAMIPINQKDEEGQIDWECYLINLRKDPVHGVLVTSTGYKSSEEDELRSSTLRFFYERIEGEQAVMLELIRSELIQLTNEFWVSFTYKGHMYDKKYLFVEGSIHEAYLTQVPVLNKKGVLIL